MDPRQEKLESQLAELEKALDNHLEDVFGERYSLHPCRMKRGKGSNPIHDGLFSATIVFSPGFGTKRGRGYIINIGISTLEMVDKPFRDELSQEAFRFVSEHLETFFPGRSLEVVEDGGLLKIVGDFSLHDE